MLGIPSQRKPIKEILCFHHGFVLNLQSFTSRYSTLLPIPACASSISKYSLYSNLLKRFASSRDLSNGLLMHHHIMACDCNIEQNEILKNNLLHMYLECGALMEARKLFDSMHVFNKFARNVIIRSYIQNGHVQFALDLFDQMHKEGMVPDTYIFVSILSACPDHIDIKYAMHIHANIVRIGLESHVIVATTLINIYGKCGMVNDALMVFEMMSERNVICWNAIIASYANGSGKDVDMLMKLYVEMQEECFLPDKVTFISVLHGCANPSFLYEGRKLHARFISCEEIKKDIIFYTALVDMYGKCGSLEEAEDIFNQIEEQNIVSWTALISVCAHHGDEKKSHHLYKQMHQEGVLGDNVTYVSILNAFSCGGNLVEGKLTHASIAGTPLESDVVVATCLLNMYSNCGNLECSRSMFNMIQEPNGYSWNSMIAAYARHGHIHEALHLFLQMHERGKTPHELAIINVLYVCGNQGAEVLGKQIHSYIVMNVIESDIVHTALIILYSKFGLVYDAYYMFDLFYEKTMVIWNAVFSVQVSNRHWKHAFQSFEQIQQEGLIPDKETFGSILSELPKLTASSFGKIILARISFCGFMRPGLINLYGKCYNLRDANNLFDVMPCQDLVAWNAIIIATVENGQIMYAFQLFLQMHLEGVIADKIVFLIFLDLCASHTLLTKGKLLHVHAMVSAVQCDVAVGTALINMYGRCGSVENAKKIFDDLYDRNLLTFTCMITIFAQHGHGSDAILLFHRMHNEGLIPDKVTYTSILCACGHSGIIEDGITHLLNMEILHDIIPVPDHFNCIIELLGKAGQLERAKNLVANIPFQPTAISWTILLDGYKRLPGVGCVNHLANHLFEVDMHDAGSYVIFSNMCVI